MPQMNQLPYVDVMERFNSVEMLLQNTQPKGKEFYDYFNIRKPILSKETYLGVIEREDLRALDLWANAIQENLHHGLIELALDQMVRFLSNIRTTPSVDGEFIKRLTSNEFKYSQEQTVHEYQHTPQKRGLFGGTKK